MIVDNITTVIEEVYEYVDDRLNTTTTYTLQPTQLRLWPTYVKVDSNFY